MCNTTNTPKTCLTHKKAGNKAKSKHNEKVSVSEVEFKSKSDRLKEEYLDRYKGVKSEILSNTRFDENSDLNMTYISKTNIIRESKIAVEEKFLILLCNPKFVNKNNWYFGLSSIYFLYPLASLPKMVKQEMPASIKQS